MRSDLIKKGVEKTPHRAVLKSLGVIDSEMNKPFIAVVCAASDYVPGHQHLHEICQTLNELKPATVSETRAACRSSSSPSAFATVLL